jgi:hypothetical protein
MSYSGVAASSSRSCNDFVNTIVPLTVRALARLVTVALANKTARIVRALLAARGACRTAAIVA